jgi:hypothetical protein
MPIRVTRSAGMLLLAVWLIPTGVAGLMPLALPAVVSAVLALLVEAPTILSCEVVGR